MQSSVTLGFVLLCALASPITSSRIRSRVLGLDENEHCDDAITKRLEDLVDRLSAYYRQCGMNDEKHMSYDDKMRKYFINAEGSELLCKKSCRSLEEFAEDAPDSSELIRECRGNPRLTALQIHDALEADRKACEEDDYVEEDTDIADNTGVEESPKTKPEVVNDDVDPNVVDIPGGSPVAPLKGNKIKQMTFEYNLKNVLAERNQPSCDKLKEVFKVCDYKRTGKVFYSQIDNMLDKLKSEKVESMDLLKAIYKKVEKDPETQAMTFKDWTFFKMGKKEAGSCALEYATRG